MKQKSFLPLVLLVICLFGCGQATSAQSQGAALPHSMKGYELYSWHTRQGWYFSLLVGTNRLKKYKEVTAPGVRLRGVAALKRKLHQLPKGEEVFWVLGRFPQIVLPPQGIEDELNAYCAQQGLKLIKAIA